MSFKVGDRVKFRNPPVERGRVIDVERGVLVVELDKQYREDGDDGLRECPESEVEPE